MDAVERIKDQLSSHAVVLYMKGSPDFPQCGFSGQVIQVMQDCRAKFMYINIFEDQEVREALKEYSQWPTFPQLYINAELVGGCDIVMDLHNQGELQKMFAAVDCVAE